jgi:hypothetical protein
MPQDCRATLLFLYLATQPFVWIANTGSPRLQWLLSHGYLEKVTGRYGGKVRLRLTEMGRAYSYEQLGR